MVLPEVRLPRDKDAAQDLEDGLETILGDEEQSLYEELHQDEEHYRKVRGLLMGTLLIPVLFYSYTKLLGRNFLVLDIALFYSSVIAAFLIYRRLSGNCLLGKYSHVTSMAVFLLLLCFLLFTYFPPGFSIFQSPRQSIQSHSQPSQSF